MSSILGLRSSYMLEYHWLFTLFLRSARHFTGAEGKWTPLPPVSLASSSRTCIFYHITFIPVLLRYTEHMWEAQKKQNLFRKYCVFIPTCLNFSHIQNTLHLMQYTHWNIFPLAQIIFSDSSIWCLLVPLPFFASPLQHRQNFPFEDCFQQGKQNHSGWDWVNRESGAQRSCRFLVKNCWTLRVAWCIQVHS